MSHIQRQKKVKFSVAQMYALVNDVDRYQSFVPYCSDSRVISSDEDEMTASLTFSFMGLKQTLTTHNQLKANEEIKLNLVSGPFKHLKGFWRFEPIEGEAASSLIIMDVEFDMALGPMMMVIEPILQQTIENLVDIFLKRAQVIYG
jgi:ribosome-associated toxin RatA of RatAB toxin-antitoxin module